jgi:signal transduction histidine kinase
LFSVGIAIASVGILGFMVFFNNKKNVTNRTFLAFSLVSIAWNIFNYSIEGGLPNSVALWALRGIMFFAVWYCFYIFQLLYVFPQEKFIFSKSYKYILIPIVSLTSLLTLTPLVFQRVSSYTPTGAIATVENGYGIYIFGVVVVALIIVALRSLIKKIVRASHEEKKSLIFVLIGTFLSFALYVVFDFIFPAFLNKPNFIQLSAVFTFPFVALTAYAIIKHHLLNIKVFATQALTFVLVITTFAQVILAKSPTAILFNSVIFLLVLSFGIFLIQSVLREVQQREQLQILDEKLEAANKQLEELSRFKSQLLSLASHQMRSPLAAIKGFGSLLIQGAYGPIPDNVKATIDKMNLSAQGLLDLINTLLDMRKVEEGKMEYQFVRTDLNAMVANVVELLRPLAGAKKLEFTFSSPGKEVFVSADPDKFKQVIQNLVDNAIKYTTAGFVHVELKEDPSAYAAGSPPAISQQGISVPPGTGHGLAIISVSDSGCGIPATLLPHLFEEFIRDERVKKQVLGTGLGLYIARKIAEAHNGTIQAESAGEEKGSGFHVRIPLL